MKAPPPPAAAIYSWSGCYFGAHVGLIAGDFRNDPGIAGPVGHASSAIGGIQTGCNWQLAPLVLGLEADISAIELSGYNAVVNFTEHWMSTFRGRVGYAFGNYLLYATGGAALTGLTGTFIGSTSTSSAQFGGTVGAGIEAFLWSPKWIGRIEYLYVDVPKDRLTVGTGIITGGSSNHVGRVAVNYKW